MNSQMRCGTRPFNSAVSIGMSQDNAGRDTAARL